jgi:hypothetical protein
MAGATLEAAMRTRAPFALLAGLLMTSCASAGPSSLAYGVPAPPRVSYAVGDTLTIALEGLGQTLEIGARSRATYDLSYAPGQAGLHVTATLASLAADIVTPMTEPIAMDEEAIVGDFDFELDATGRATSMTSPEASGGGQVFAAPIVAHTLFPRLSGGAASVGESWTDSVTYSETTEAGTTSVASTLTYTVLGETEAGGRALLEIGFAGTAEISQALSIEGATITQASEVDVDGSLEWDVAAGLLYSSESTMAGAGRVRVAMLPAELPTTVRWVTRVQLEG